MSSNSFPLDSSSLIVVVEAAATVRQMITDVLKNSPDSANAKIQSCTSLSELLSMMEVETPSWVICQSFADSPLNIFQMLALIVERPHLRKVRFSMFVESGKEAIEIPIAFERGALSWHRKSYVRDDIEAEFSDLFTTLKVCDYDEVLTAGQYLRRWLDSAKKWNSRMALEEHLVTLYPGSTKALLHMAEGLFHTGKTDLGCRTLGQIQIIQPKSKPHCDRMLARFKIVPDSNSMESADGKSPLGIKSCVLVDPDSSVQKTVTDILSSLGVSQIECFSSGDQAWAWIKDGHPLGLLITEWRIPDLPGPALVQRLRQDGLHHMPIICTSSLVEESDHPLMQEMGIDLVVPKPFSNHQLIAAIVSVLRQQQRPSEQKSLELKVQRLLNLGRIEEAKRLAAHYMKDDRISSSDKLVMEGRFEYAIGNFDRCRALCGQAIRNGQTSAFAYNLLGKCLLQKRMFKAALLCLERANSLSPDNIERLVNMAIANRNLGEISKANALLADATAKDSGNLKVVETNVAFALEDGDVAKARNLIAELENSKSILSFMNARAVSLAQTGRFDDAILLYERTLVSIPSDWHVERKAVLYNQGLAFARYGNLEKAAVCLVEPSGGKDSLGIKAKSLLKRVKNSIDSGTPLEVAGPVIVGGAEVGSGVPGEKPIADEADQQTSTSFAEELLVAAPVRGDICCHLLFTLLEGLPTDAAAISTTAPRYNQRTAILKEVSLPKKTA